MTRLRTVSIIIGAVVLAVGVGAVPAGARRLPFKIGNYQVVYKGSGTYSVSRQSQGGSFTKVSSKFHWAVHYHLQFLEMKGEQVAAITGPLSVGSGDWSISSDNGGNEKCTRNGGLELNKEGSIAGRVQPSGKVILHLVPGSNADYKTTDGSSGHQACDTTDFWHDWVTSFSHIGSDQSAETDPLTAFVALSKHDLSFGKLVFNVSNHTLAAPSLTIDPDCGSGNGTTCQQSYDWKGSVTFKKQR